MMNEQGQTPSNAPRIFAAAMLFGLRTFAVPLDVITHRGFGKRYLGLQAAAAILIIPVFGMFFPGHDPRPLFGFLALYLVMCVAARIGIGSRQEAPIHSYYNGFPRFSYFRRMPESTVKRLVEPMGAFVAGAMLLSFNQPLGAFVILAGLAQGTLATSAEAYERCRVQALNDSLIAQREIGHRLRAMHGDRL